MSLTPHEDAVRAMHEKHAVAGSEMEQAVMRAVRSVMLDAARMADAGRYDAPINLAINAAASILDSIASSATSGSAFSEYATNEMRLYMLAQVQALLFRGDPSVTISERVASEPTGRA